MDPLKKILYRNLMRKMIVYSLSLDNRFYIYRSGIRRGHGDNSGNKYSFGIVIASFIFPSIPFIFVSLYRQFVFKATGEQMRVIEACQRLDDALTFRNVGIHY